MLRTTSKAHAELPETIISLHTVVARQNAPTNKIPHHLMPQVLLHVGGAIGAVQWAVTHNVMRTNLSLSSLGIILAGCSFVSEDHAQRLHIRRFGRS